MNSGVEEAMSEARKLDFDLLTQTDAAAMLGVTRRTIYNYVKRGEGPPVTVIGGRLWYRSDLLHDWLAAQTLPQGVVPACYAEGRAA